MYILISGFVSILTSLVFLIIIRKISLRFNYIKTPQIDRWHKSAIPTYGGISIYMATIIGVLTYTTLAPEKIKIEWGIIAGMSVIFFLGLIDDIHALSPAAKLIGQIAASGIIVYQGYVTNFFTPRMENIVLASIPNIILTFFWLVGITNAFNLLDNMDGLAAGVALIAGTILGYFFWSSGDHSLLVIIIPLICALVGFLILNFPPAKIFMGDCGSLYLGFTLAVLGIARQPQASNVFAVMGVPTLLFLLPIFDTGLVTITRLMRGQSPIQGGRDHTSHRLIAFGLSERQAVMGLYFISILAGLVAVQLETLNYDLSLLLVPFLLIALAILTAYLGGLKIIQTGNERPKSRFAKIITDLTHRRRILEIILDFFIICLSYYLAYWINFGINLSAGEIAQYSASLPIALICTYTIFFIFGVYRDIWRYVGINNFLSYIRTSFFAAIITYIIIVIIQPAGGPSRVIIILFGTFLFLGLVSTRSSFRILDLLFSRQNKVKKQRVLIVGVSKLGEMALRWLQMNPELGYQPIGYIDEDDDNVGKIIQGVPILGTLHNLHAIVTNYEIDGLIITYSQSNELVSEESILIYEKTGCWVKHFNLNFEPEC